MNPLIMIVMLVLIVVMSYRNFAMMKRYSKNKDYIVCYEAMMNNDEKAYSLISDYIEKAQSEEYANKARVFKLFYDVEKGDYQEEINKLDLKDLFYTNGKVDNNKILFNNETLLWIVNLMAKANKIGNKEVVNKLFEIVDNQKEAIGDYVEYNLIKSACEIFNGKEEGNVFLNNLLNGEYSEYKYDKSTIGVSKRVAAGLLSYSNQDNEDFAEDLKRFAHTKYGLSFEENLGIIDKYRDKQEETINEIVEKLEEETKE